jgi:hypothetical protein
VELLSARLTPRNECAALRLLQRELRARLLRLDAGLESARQTPEMVGPRDENADWAQEASDSRVGVLAAGYRSSQRAVLQWSLAEIAARLVEQQQRARPPRGRHHQQPPHSATAQRQRECPRGRVRVREEEEEEEEEEAAAAAAAGARPLLGSHVTGPSDASAPSAPVLVVADGQVQLRSDRHRRGVAVGVASGAALLRVPFRRLLSAERALDCAWGRMLTSVASLEEETVLMLFLIWERHRGTHSPWAGYFAQLAEAEGAATTMEHAGGRAAGGSVWPTGALSWTEQERAWLDGSEAGDGAAVAFWARVLLLGPSRGRMDWNLPFAASWRSCVDDGKTPHPSAWRRARGASGRAGGLACRAVPGAVAGHSHDIAAAGPSRRAVIILVPVPRQGLHRRSAALGGGTGSGSRWV